MYALFNVYPFSLVIKDGRNRKYLKRDSASHVLPVMKLVTGITDQICSYISSTESFISESPLLNRY